jgi:hypothetical protein
MNRSRLTFGLAASVLILIATGCGEKDVSYLTYQDEMIRYITDSRDGREIFTTDLYSKKPFYVKGDTIHQYIYRIDSVKRSTNVEIAKSPRDIYPFTNVYDALASVEDEFFGNMYRLDGADTIFALKVVNVLTRYGYFIKIYGDSHPYKGWQFWGFVGGMAPTTPLQFGQLTWDTDMKIEVKSPEYKTDYIQEDDFPMISAGTRVTYNGLFDQRFHAEQTEGQVDVFAADQRNNHRVSWNVPSTADKYYHSILFEEEGYLTYDTTRIGGKIIIDSVLYRDWDFVVPYKIIP